MVLVLGARVEEILFLLGEEAVEVVRRRGQACGVEIRGRGRGLIAIGLLAGEEEVHRGGLKL